ncbi:MAG: minor capsid protein [Alphaproteobacteria bacterium]|nr:minor capsid protein [Alphaproteobacteria bacterium]MBF0251201.1 minor capsid protein [Alphaproteobacteria bacterium]
MIFAIKAFQADHGLRQDGVMKPEGITLRAINDELTSLFPPSPPRTTQPRKDLLLPPPAAEPETRERNQPYHPESAPKAVPVKDEEKDGTYIWRTVGDGNVRSSHAARDGQVFSWDHPPEGGHPGEAPNCRCRAEPVEDKKEKDRQKRCENLGRLMAAAQANLNNASDRWNNAAQNLKTAKDNLDAKRLDCARARDEALTNIGAGAIVGGVTGGRIGGWPGAIGGAAYEGASAATASLERIYEACIDDSTEMAAYNQAKQEEASAYSWLEHYRTELSTHREEYEQLGCEG